MKKIKQHLSILLIILVVLCVSAFTAYFVYTELYGSDGANVIGGEPHTQNIYEINQKNGLNSFPTTGNPKILVIPVSFTDYERYSTESYRKKIEKTFFVEDENDEESYKKSETSWLSVAQYYYLSSGGNLKIRGKVADWFDVGIPSYELTKHRTENPDYRNSGEDGTWWLLNQAVEWYKTKYGDINTFDTDNDNYYDLIWMVYNCPYYNKDNGLSSTFWAFTFAHKENYLLASNVNKMPYIYCFASLHFIFEGYGQFGYDSHTYVHETGHALGLNDYYSLYAGPKGGADSYPFGGVDMMDFNIGDHCSFSKYKLGWTSPKAVISTAGEYKLKSTSDTGEFFIISKNFAGHPFDEYFIIEYVTPTNINKGDYTNPYRGNGLQGYSKPGIRISHIDSRGIRITKTNNDYNYEHETRYKYIDGVIINNSTRESIYRLENGNYCRENTIMQKDFTTFNTSVLSPNYPMGKTIDDLLFYTGEFFSLEQGSKYRELMPSKSNKLNNGKTFDFKIQIKSIGEEAIIQIS